MKQKIEQWNREIEDRIEKQRKSKILEDALQAIQVADTPKKCQRIIEALDSIAGFEGVEEARTALQNRNERLAKIQDKLSMFNEQLDLIQRITVYEEEKEGLGLFAGRRRSELEDQIYEARRRMFEIEEQYEDSSIASIAKTPLATVKRELQ